MGRPCKEVPHPVLRGPMKPSVLKGKKPIVLPKNRYQAMDYVHRRMFDWLVSKGEAAIK